MIVLQILFALMLVTLGAYGALAAGMVAVIGSPGPNSVAVVRSACVAILCLALTSFVSGALLFLDTLALLR